MPPRFNLPPLTRILLAALVTCTVFNAVLKPRAADWVSAVGTPLVSVGNGVPFLAIVPRASIWYPWVFLTATVVEQNVFGLLITGATVFYGGKYLERAWSSAEFAKFILFVTMIPNLLCFVIYVVWFAVTKRQGGLNTTISGGIAIQAGFLVSFKQLVPEHTVSLFRGMIKMRVKHFPAIFLLANTISGVLFVTDTAMYLSWFGFFTSWIYLRFYRYTESLSTSATGEGSYIRGDASDTFAFAHFFPEPIHTPVAKITEEVWKVLLALKICTPFSNEDVDAGNEQASARAEGGLPSIMNAKGGSGGGRREEAERRRALALKALDQRLQVAASRGVAQKPVVPATSSVEPPSSSAGEADVRPHEAET